MNRFALSLLSSTMAFAQVKQVSRGDQSPTISHIKGSVAITYYATYTVCESPKSAVFPYSSYSPGSSIGVAYPSSIGDTRAAVGMSLLLPDSPSRLNSGLFLPSKSLSIAGFASEDLVRFTSDVTPSWSKHSVSILEPLVMGSAYAHRWPFEISDTFQTRLLTSVSGTIDFTVAASKSTLESSTALLNIGAYSPGFPLPGTSTGIAIFELPSLESISRILGSTPSSMDSSLRLRGLGDLANFGINAAGSGGLSIGGEILELSPLAKTLGSPSLLVGSDYQSLSKELADLTAQGKKITGWTIAYSSSPSAN